MALTFDDGPCNMTPAYLDCLASLGVTATFFLVGECAARFPELVLEYVRRGHEVASHGFTHTEFPKLSPQALSDELFRTQTLLPLPSGKRPWVRPPRGTLNARTAARMLTAGFRIAMWSLDSDDCRTEDPDHLRGRVSPASVGAGEVVLLHEEQAWTLDALPGMVRALRAAGYLFCTLSEIARVP